MKRYLFALFFTCFTSFLGAEDEMDLSLLLSTSAERILDKRENFFLTSTDYRITPKVSPVTGEYSEEECDLVVAGCQPLSLRRFYSHFAPYDARYGSWRYNPESILVANFEWKRQESFAAIGDFDGTMHSFKKVSHDTFAFEAGNHFIASGMNGQTHPLNTKIQYWRRGDPKNKHRWEYMGIITDGSGRKRSFKSRMHQWTSDIFVKAGKMRSPMGRVYNWHWRIIPNTWTPYQVPITEEILPNGNILVYTYTQWQKEPLEYPKSPLLDKITAYNSIKTKVLGFLQFSYPRAKNGEVGVVQVTGSDGRKVSLHQGSNNPVLLTNAERKHEPSVSYGFQGIAINKVERPEGRVITTQYEAKSNRVSSQHAPVGPKGELCPIGRYEYQDRATIVYDAENNKTIYRYDENKKLVTLEVYEGNSLYKVERFVWEKGTGNLSEKTIEDGNGSIAQINQYEYDKNQNPIVERIGVGNELRRLYRTFSEDGFNLKLSESDGFGKTVRYNYKPRSNLIVSEFVYDGDIICKRTFHTYDDCATRIRSVVDDGQSTDENNLRGVTYRKITEITSKQELPCFGLPLIVLEKTIDHTGKELLISKVVYTYTSFGKVAEERHYDANDNYCYSIVNEYDDHERLIVTQDPLGNRTAFSYDANFNLTSIAGPRDCQFRTITYDKANRPICFSEREEHGKELSIEKRYDKLGRVIEEIDGCKNIKRYTYDALSRVTAIYYPDGGVEKKEYDILGNLIREIDPNGYATVKKYNVFGQVVSVDYPDQSKERFTYDGRGNLSVYEDKNGAKTHYTYDIFGHVLKEEVQSSSGTILKSSLATWSAFNKLYEEIDDLTISYSYDFVGRKVKEKQGYRDISYIYDSLGRLKETREGDSRVIEEHDVCDHLIEKRLQNGETLQTKENYLYDEAGNLTQVINFHGATTTIYNSYGKPLSIQDPLGFTTNCSYDYQDNYIEKRVTAKGIESTTVYDSANREILSMKKNSLGEVIQKSESVYDKCGNRIQLIHTVLSGTIPTSVFTVEWVYGPMNRIERMIEQNKKITNFLYDKCGRLAIKIKPDGTKLHREYDELGRLTRYYSHDFDYLYFYDQRSRLLSVIDSISGQTTNRIYDPLNNILEETLGSDITLKSTFDLQCRRIGITFHDYSQAAYFYLGNFLYSISRKGLVYTYISRNLKGGITAINLPAELGSLSIDWDGCGRWKNIYSSYFSANYTNYDSVGNLCEYSFNDSLGQDYCYYAYDALDQIISENDHIYEYDSLYNRKAKDCNHYVINDLHQVLHDGEREFTFDRNGNLLSDGIYEFVYDAQDRLIEIYHEDNRITYTYDPFHRRLSKTIYLNHSTPETKFYLWDGDNEIGICDNDGKIEELRILGEGFGAEIGSAVIIELNDKTYIPIHDHRGCVITLIEPNTKQSVGTYRYTAFGEEVTKGKLSPWRFASKRVDKESGLIFFGRRYYSSLLGRWMTPDPQGFDNGVNLYAYLFNSPITDYDLYGLWSVRESWNNAKYFMWGAIEGSTYHLHNIASNIGMRDLSSPGWKPRSFLSGQEKVVSDSGLNHAEKAFLPFTYEARRLGNDHSKLDHMRARGRTFGEQAITLGGLLSAFHAGKSILNNRSSFCETTRIPTQELSRQYLFSGKPLVSNSTSISKGSRRHFQPDMGAEGAHSVFRRDPISRRVTHYETYRPQTNPHDPKPWESVIRFDAVGKSHLNKSLDFWCETPHIHDPYSPGGIRFPNVWELPK